MKILRRHLGFTTNSSASSEWSDISQMIRENPEKFGLPPKEDDEQDATEENAATPTSDREPEPPPSFLAENLLAIGGLLLALLGIFALERILRRAWARHRAREDDDD